MRIVLITILFIIAIGSVVTSLSLLSKADFIHITSVEVTGTHLVHADSVEAFVENSLTGDWWKIFFKDSIFLYPRHTLEQSIVKDFPPIALVSFSHTGFHVLDVTVTERSPFALACNESGRYTESCFYMDSTGFVYARAPQFSSGVYVTYTAVSPATTSSTTASTSVTVGTYLTDPTDFEIADQAVSYISGLGLNVVGINVPLSGNDFQLFIQRPAETAKESKTPISASSTIATSSPHITVYFNTSQPLDTTLEYFSVFWNHETDKNFQYIDLRYGKDIVFKME
jgi:hypothetical protein